MSKVKLIKRLKMHFRMDQGKVDQILQGQEVGAIAKQETILTTQKKITEALKDLRRKANVNISRTDDILKKLKKQK